MLKRINPTKTKSWKKLTAHYTSIKKHHMRDMFRNDPDRFSKFSIVFEDMLFDYSKNIINEKTIELFCGLLKEVGLKEAIHKMFNGDKINETENRAVLHVALRDRSNNRLILDGKDIRQEVNSAIQRIKDCSNKILSGEWQGYTGERIKDIINIGIGGSDLGPSMVCEALKPHKKANINSHFVSNVDASQISGVLNKLRPQTTLFMIASKKFNTQETMTNANTARKWFIDSAKKQEYIKKHFIAISTNKDKVKDFGIDPENMFVFWDWVGGRFSLWSSIGLSIACLIGFDNFIELLEGAYAMDNHFRQTTFQENIPVTMAILNTWYNNFFGACTQAILPYDQNMHLFPSYLQQLEMESNGKYVDRNGKVVNYQTSPIIWGEPGTNGQHAFYQLIHQGTKLIPCDFIAPCISSNPIGKHHKILLSNFFAQSEALMKGKTKKEVQDELKVQGKDKKEIEKLTPFKIFEGNRPTNSIIFKKLTPRTLGSLIAMYEHKVFVQGVIWNIFSFDQWGVELGKQLAGKVLEDIENTSKVTTHDCSTNNLINTFKDFSRQR